MISNFHWPEPENDFDERLISNVKTYGCHVMNIFADESGPGWAFSIGLYVNFGHPEVIIFGLKERTAHLIINDICGRVARGERFEAGDRSNLLLEGLDVSFVDFALPHYRDHLGYGNWFYSSLPDLYPVLQLVWPDR